MKSGYIRQHNKMACNGSGQGGWAGSVDRECRGELGLGGVGKDLERETWADCLQDSEMICVVK